MTILEDTRTDSALPGEYGYRLSATGASSACYGPCAICASHVSDVVIQTEFLRFDTQERGLSWTVYQCSSLFGHRSCLEGARRAQSEGRAA